MTCGGTVSSELFQYIFNKRSGFAFQGSLLSIFSHEEDLTSAGEAVT